MKKIYNSRKIYFFIENTLQRRFTFLKKIIQKISKIKKEDI